MNNGEPIISALDLTKHYRVAQREEGFTGAIKYLFSRSYQIIKAVDNVTFDIYPGEMVGYIGRNGAGKSTTIKMLTGILVPTDGQLVVDGLVPYRRRIENGRKIGVVFGQRTQLRWDIPVVESLRLLSEMYEIPDQVYRDNLALFSEVLELNGLLSRPVRKLSLGQRMKCDLAASFLHNPKIVYLDEPTIGLDIVVKDRIRAFVRTVNGERGTTVLLATHDLEDIDQICERAMVIDRGRVVYDGGIDALKARYGCYQFITYETRDRLAGQEGSLRLPQGAELVDMAEHRIKLRVDKDVLSSSQVTKLIIDRFDVQDMGIEETNIESVVKRIYQELADETADESN